MSKRYEVGNVDGQNIQKYGLFKNALVDLNRRMENKQEGPWQLRQWGQEDWSFERDRKDTLDRIRAFVRDGQVGHGVSVHGHDSQPRFFICSYEHFDSKGKVVVQAALSQKGVPYIWAAEWPNHAFDCSGLVKWCYGLVDVNLPHQSDDMMHVPAMKFTTKPKNGDIVFMHFSGPEGYASHVGIYWNGKMIDTRSWSEPVAVREIETSAVLHYGYVESVTGPHG